MGIDFLKFKVLFIRSPTLIFGNMMCLWDIFDDDNHSPDFQFDDDDHYVRGQAKPLPPEREFSGMSECSSSPPTLFGSPLLRQRYQQVIQSSSSSRRTTLTSSSSSQKHQMIEISDDGDDEYPSPSKFIPIPPAINANAAAIRSHVIAENLSFNENQQKLAGCRSAPHRFSVAKTFHSLRHLRSKTVDIPISTSLPSATIMSAMITKNPDIILPPPPAITISPTKESAFRPCTLSDRLRALAFKSGKA
jgi:hypothetical protein